MLPSEPSIAAIASLLPFPNASDLPDRLARLASRLRDASMTQDGKALFEMAADALASLPDEPVSADRAMCLLFVTRYRFYSGNAFAGLAPAGQAAALAEQLGDPVLSAKAMKMLGVVHLETGNYPGAVSAFTAALAAARVAGDAVQEVEILSNLGLAHQYAGHYSAAVPCYERAVEAAEAAGTPPLSRATPLANIALACLHLRDFPRGLAAAERAIEALEAPADTHERAARTLAECYYTRLLLEVRNLPLARERAKLARLYASGTSELSELFADMTQGLVDTNDPAMR